MLIKQEKFDSPLRNNLYKSAAYQSKESLTEVNTLNLKQQHSDAFGHSQEHLSKLHYNDQSETDADGHISRVIHKSISTLTMQENNTLKNDVFILEKTVKNNKKDDNYIKFLGGDGKYGNDIKSYSVES